MKTRIVIELDHEMHTLSGILYMLRDVLGRFVKNNPFLHKVTVTEEKSK